MGKINLNDTALDVIIKLSEGNPGAITTLTELANSYKSFFEVAPDYLTIDTMGLYDSQLYMLWNDCCDRNIEKVKQIIKLYREGKITSRDIDERIKNGGRGKSFDDLI